MRLMNSSILGRMQGTQDSAMADTCLLLRYTPGPKNAHGKPDKSGGPGANYTASAPLACGFKNDTDKSSDGEGEAKTDIGDAELRIPLGTVLTNYDRVRITHRQSVAITPEEFEITGKPRRGPTAIILILQRAADDVGNA